MYKSSCPLCKCKFYCADKENAVFHSRTSYKSKKKKQEKNLRTSTPVPDSDVTSSFTDSVLDFFYQTWKNGLLSTSGLPGSRSIMTTTTTVTTPGPAAAAAAPHEVQIPVGQTPAQQVVYFNMVVYQSLYPNPLPYTQPVGYREDGTFGVLTPYWPYFAP